MIVTYDVEVPLVVTAVKKILTRGDKIRFHMNSKRTLRGWFNVDSVEALRMGDRELVEVNVNDGAGEEFCVRRGLETAAEHLRLVRPREAGKPWELYLEEPDEDR